MIFVYGTFRRGFGRRRILWRLGARYVGEGIVRGELFNLGGFPGAQKSKTASARIAGEIYQLRNPVHALKVLDRVEDSYGTDPASSFFRRETAEVLLSDGRRVTAWVYWLTRVPWPARRILSGDYSNV